MPRLHSEENIKSTRHQYWKPVWESLERYWKPIREKREGARRKSGTLHLAQAQSNRGRRGRKRDFADAERMVKRLVARELILSFVPDAEQRLWRTATRKKYQLRRDRVWLQNQMESLLEEAHIELSSLVTDLLGVGARLLGRNCILIGSFTRHWNHCLVGRQSADRLDDFQADFACLLGADFADPDHAAAHGVERLLVEDEFDRLATP